MRFGKEKIKEERETSIKLAIVFLRESQHDQ